MVPIAVTVTGVFRVIDRASGPMDKMRRTAERLDKALMGAGDRMDDLGTSRQLESFDRTERAMRKMDTAAEMMGGTGGSGSGSLGKTRTQMRGLGDDSDRLSFRLGRLAAAFTGVQKIIMLLKLPLIVTGVVALTQAVGALAGGLVGLTPALADTVGLLGAMPAALTGVALAATTVSIAFSGMGAAIEGTEGAMAKLTPQARALVREIRSLKPIGREIRESAQAGLFPGVTDALRTISQRRPVNTVRRLVGGAGRALGNTASRAAEAFTRPGFLRDFERVGRQGNQLMGRLGSSLINVAHALIDVAVAARPFTNWLSETIQGWTVGWREAANLNRKTGEMGDFFDRARDSLERFGSIAENLWDTFRGLGRAARPLGEDLWNSADRATDRWARFTNSVAGQTELRDYFNRLRRPLHAIFDFVGELGKAIMRLGASGGLTETFQGLTRAIGPLERAFRNIGRNLGPSFAETVHQLVRLFANLTEQSGAFGAVVRLFNSFLSAVNALLENVPGLTNLFTGVLGALALSRLGARIQGLAASWGLVATQATRATVAQRAAGMASPGVIGGVFGRGRGRAPAPTTTPYGPVPYVGPSLGGGLGKGVGALARGAGRFFAPVAGVMALSDFLSTQGSFTDRLHGAVSGATLGLIPGPVTDAEKRTEARQDQMRWLQDLARDTPGTGFMGARARAGEIRAEIAGLRGDQGVGRTVTDAAGNVIGQVDNRDDTGDTDRIKMLTRQLRREEQVMVAGSRRMGARAAIEFGQAWQIHSRRGGARGAMDELLGPASRRLQWFARHDAPEAARIFGNSMLQMAAHAKRQNPKLAGEYDRLENQIERSFRRMGQTVEVVNGKIYTGSRSEWQRISGALSNQAEKARQDVSKAFTAMQQEAVGSLVAMGYNRQQATNIVQGLEQGGAAGAAARMDLQGPTGAGQRRSVSDRNRAEALGYATGGRLGGLGLQDTVPVPGGRAAPGELILSRHTEAEVDRDLAYAGKPPLGRRVGKGRPHYMPPSRHAVGGRLRFARGGLVPAPGFPGETINSAVIPAFQSLVRRFNLFLTDAYGPGHQSSEHTQYGTAIDVVPGPGGTWEDVNRAVAYSVRAGYNPVYYDGSGGSIALPPHGPGHHAHITLLTASELNAGQTPGAVPMLGGAAMSGPLGGMVQPIRLKDRRSKVGGAPGAMANAAMGAMRRGMQGKINQRIGAMGVGGAMGGMAIGVGGPLRQYNRSFPWDSPQAIPAGAVAKIAEMAGLPGITFMQIAKGESGFQPGAIGHDPGGTIGHGLWQITSGYNDDIIAKLGGPQAMLNPFINARAAKMIYDRAGIGAWYGTQYMTGTNLHLGAGSGMGGRRATNALGGRIPNFAGWFGNGFNGTVDSPTVFGAGESGKEHVKITPAGRGRAGGGVSIGTVKIENHRPGDIKKQLKDEVDAAFRELADDFDIDVDDSGVIA